MIEGVKELLFCSLAAGQIMNIIHKQDIDASVFLTEVENLSILKMIDQIVHELFGGDVHNFLAAVVFQRQVSDGIHQVRFAQSRTPIDVQRVV